MKILYLVYGTHSGIVPSHAEGLRRLGAAVEIRNVGGDLNYRMESAKLPSFAPHNLRNTAEAILRYGREWRWFYKRTDYAFRWMSRKARDVVAANSGSFDVILQSGVLFNGNPGPGRVPHVLHLDHTYALSKKAGSLSFLPSATPASAAWEQMEHETYHQADLIFSMSDSVRRSLLHDYGIPEEKIVVIGGGPNFVDLPAFDGARSPRPVVLFVGKDFVRKGGPVLLDAFALVREEVPEAVLKIIGPSEPVRAPGVEFIGQKTHEEMPPFYEESRIFVMPSWREPFGIAFIEAMAYGLPCIGTDIEAIPEIIDHEATGFLVKPGDKSELAGRIIELLRDDSRAMEMGRRGRRKVEAELNWQAVSEKMFGHLKALLGSPPS